MSAAIDAGIVEAYFPELTDAKRKQLALLGPLYKEWNERINVISRKDIDNLYLNHVLHSLAIAKIISFKSEPFSHRMAWMVVHQSST